MDGYKNLIGTWRSSIPWDSSDYLCEYTVLGSESHPEVQAVDLQDGEEFVVSDVAWDGNALSFRTLMPSTGRIGVCRFRAESDDQIVSEFTFTETERLTRYGA
jgi:hypothetical protein